MAEYNEKEQYIANITPERSSLVIVAELILPEDCKSHNIKLVYMTIDDSDDDASEIMDAIINGRVFINGLLMHKALSSNSMKSSAAPFIFTIRFDHTMENFPEGSFKLDFQARTDKGTYVYREYVTVYVSKSDVRELGSYSLDGQQIGTSLSSFMLMRTNPKLTGNIKLVVSADDKLYLDTFKVSLPLNDRVYRKYPVSSEGNYPFDVMTVFSRLPRLELFRLPSDSLNPHKVFTSYDEQYLTEYEYGAETNTDDMYSENMRLLAPLHLGKNVPDFFCIFRYEGVMNRETYNSVINDDTERLKEIISDSEVVRIVDLRGYTAAGQYLRNYQSMLKDFLYGSCYLQFIEQENADDEMNIRQGTDSWKGIDVARGLITNMMESSYFKTQVLKGDVAVQERFNNYIINGYERNNVLYPYILNLEFLFNDELGGDEFSMHRYFGLYLTENMLVRYDSIIRYMQSGTVLKLDENDNVVDDGKTINAVSSSDLKDRIFFMTTNNDAMRVSSQSGIDTFVSLYVLNNPDRHIATLMIKEKEWASDERSFMTMAFTKTIHYGEHFRLIARNIRQNGQLRNICVDIIASNDERLAKTDNNISAYIQTNSPESHKDADGKDIVPTDIYRFSFYTQEIDDVTTAASLSEQLQRMAAGIRKYVPYVHVEAVTGDRLGLTSYHTDVWVQHLMPVNYAPLPDFRYLNIEETSSVIRMHWGGTSDKETHQWLTMLSSALSKVTDKYVWNPEQYYEDSVYFQDGHVYTKDKKYQILDDRFVAYCEYYDESAMIDDTVCYFSSDDTVKMRPISPDTWWYSPEYLVFSLADFEVLGWRWSSVVQFMKTSELATVYTIYDDITELLSSVRHPLTKADDGNFYPNCTFEFTSGFVTDNALLLLGKSEWHTHTQRIEQSLMRVMTVMSPEEPDQPMMMFGNRLDSWKPFVHNSQLSIYNPESAQISVMGITEVRDLDMYIGDDRIDEVTSKDTIIVKSGETLVVDSREDDRMKSDVVYTVESGSFRGFELYRFIICGNTVYYTKNSADEVTEQKTLSGGRLTADSDVVLTLETSSSQYFDFIQRIPGQNPDNFLVNPDDPNNSKLSISVVPQTNCLWQSNGMYFDGCSTLDVSTLTERYTQRGYFTEHAFTLQHDGRSAAWSTDSYASVNGINYNFRKLITSRGISAAVRKMLISNYPIRTAVGYYNPFVQSLEFIYYGLKFNIKFNGDYYNLNIRIGDYNNFDVYVIDEYAPDEENEIYISTVEEMILIVNHKFDGAGSQTSRKSGSVFRVGDYGLDGEDCYNVETAPYGIYTNTICGYTGEGGSMVARRDSSDESIVTADSSTWFVLEDFPQDLYAGDASTLLSHYVYFPGTSDVMDESGTVVNVKGEHVGILRRKTGGDASTVSYDTPIDDISDYVDLTRQLRRQRRSFVVSLVANSSCDNTCNNDAESLDEYIESLSGDFHCYIVSENSTDEVVITEDYKPVIITMTRPQRIKFNFGYFTPRTYDIITMSQNDYTVAERCGISLLLSGTNIESVKKLNTYTGNRVIPDTINTPIARNYFVVSDWSVMRSNWDAKYYRTYSEDGSYKLIDGYVPGIEDKTFIGSRCMILKSDHITLDDFSSVRIGAKTEYVSSAYNTQAKNVRQVKMTINITQAIYFLFESSQAFIDNWVDIQGDIETSVRNYIKNSVSKIYNRQRRREVSLLIVRDPELTEMDVVFGVPSQRDKWEETDDYDAEMTVSQNDEMMLVITMTERPGYKVHPVVKIFRTIE